MATKRWTYEHVDSGDVYTFAINPKSMSSPIGTAVVGTSAAGVRNGANAPTTQLERGVPVQWQFGGFIRTQAQHDAMDAWNERSGKVLVTDHLDRVFECFLQSFEATERKASRTTPDRWTYTVKALLLRQSA